MMTTKALIIGGGIGGLTAALSLHRAGIEVAIYESVSDIQALGVGINVLPHAVRILDGLGLREALERTAIITSTLRFHSRQGQTIWAERRGVEAGYDYPQYSIHRGQLQAALLAAVRQRLGDDAIRPGHHLQRFEQTGSGVAATFIDKRTGAGVGTYEGPVLIGADGIWSQVRAQFSPDEGPPVYSGQMLWRGVTEADPVFDGRSVIMAGSNDLKAVIYPISEASRRQGRSLLNWVAERRPGGDLPLNPADWNRPGNPDDFIPYFADWQFEWLDVPALFAAAERVYEFPMVDRNPLPKWTFGRVTLLGDAAHAMRPNGSNGASQAILDAEAIARCLSADDNAERALMAYEDERLQPTSQLVLDNRETGPERVLELVAERCPDGFDNIADVIPRDELQAIADSYKKLARFDRESVNRPS
jgi:2-polyprenyl-6-methoxyphenol hydroxylase-like FAD-dependent oxidoreductase